MNAWWIHDNFYLQWCLTTSDLDSPIIWGCLGVRESGMLGVLPLTWVGEVSLACISDTLKPVNPTLNCQSFVSFQIRDEFWDEIMGLLFGHSQPEEESLIQARTAFCIQKEVLGDFLVRLWFHLAICTLFNDDWSTSNLATCLCKFEVTFHETCHITLCSRYFFYRNICILPIYLGIDNLSLSQGQVKQRLELRLSFIIVFLFMVLKDVHMS